MYTETLSYFQNGTECKGYIAYDDRVETKRPAVLIVHAWRGQDDFARQKAVELADLGYVGFAVDMYGDGQCVVIDEDAKALMLPLFLDRALLQERIRAAVEHIRGHPVVDPQNIGAIGFCFGGLTVYELLRKGVGIKGAVSFHGTFATELEGHRANTVPINPEASGSLLILHGHEDPWVSDEDFKELESEMTQAGIDWQIHIYGLTTHAFTNPKANDWENGRQYSEKASRRAYRAMQNFFEEVFE